MTFCCINDYCKKTLITIDACTFICTILIIHAHTHVYPSECLVMCTYFYMEN